jgi:pimeloyl-ACP methyl ester carboxylesterase
MRQFNVSRISLAGFSLGGRVCLKIIEIMPEAVETALLLAPDGLVANPLYWFVTAQPLGRHLFHRFLQRPGKYIRFADWLLGWKLIDASHHRFLLQYVSSPFSRNFLEKVWPGMRLLVPDRRKVRAGVRRWHIPVHVFMGRYDRIIPLRQAYSFSGGIPEIKVHVLEKGHRLIDAETLSKIAECLIHP